MIRGTLKKEKNIRHIPESDTKRSQRPNDTYAVFLVIRCLETNTKLRELRCIGFLNRKCVEAMFCIHLDSTIFSFIYT